MGALGSGPEGGMGRGPRPGLLEMMSSGGGELRRACGASSIAGNFARADIRAESNHSFRTSTWSTPLECTENATKANSVAGIFAAIHAA